MILIFAFILQFYSISLPVEALNLEKTEQSSSLAIQDTITWEMLSKIKFKKTLHEEYGYVNTPLFTEELKVLRNKKVVLKGYIIPLDTETYVLSRYVYASCFFCGGAGAESIVGLNFKSLNKRLKTDQFVVIKGTLLLNDSDVNDWIFHLDNAEII